MRQSETIKVEDIRESVEIPSDYIGIIRNVARVFSCASLISPVSAQDLLKATLRAHASLNQRDKVCMDDLRFILMVRRYLPNPFSPYDGLIVKYRSQGFSIREIARKIGKGNYNQQIQRVIRKAELRGILNSESPHRWDDNNPLKSEVK